MQAEAIQDDLCQSIAATCVLRGSIPSSDAGRYPQSCLLYGREKNTCVRRNDDVVPSPKLCGRGRIIPLQRLIRSFHRQGLLHHGYSWNSLNMRIAKYQFKSMGFSGSEESKHLDFLHKSYTLKGILRFKKVKCTYQRYSRQT
jgi:hypothetical protein